MGLGAVHTINLAMARIQASKARALLQSGIDPIHERHRHLQNEFQNNQRQKTFLECTEAVLSIKEQELKNPKDTKQWRSSLEAYALPSLGKKLVADIDRYDVLQVIEPIWVTKNETANRVRSRIKKILDYAKANDMREGDNPAEWSGNLDSLLPARRKVRKVIHHPALDYREAPNFITQLHTRAGLAAKALELLILTAARSQEVREATWEEIDLDNMIWVIPEERMKKAKEHRVPLSKEAAHLLQNLPRLVKSELIFPAPRGGALTDVGITKVIRRMGNDVITVHGFRSTFKDWAGETTSNPREVIEHALAHHIKDKTEAAYQRGDLLSKRRCLMQEWADFCYINQNG